MENACLFDLDLDIDTDLTHDKYEFMAEYHFGAFVVVPFARQEEEEDRLSSSSPPPSTNKDESLHIIVYENGDIIDPTKDFRFKRKAWIRPGTPWVNHTFSRTTLQQVLKDIQKVKSAKTSLRRRKLPGHVRRPSKETRDLTHHKLFPMFEEQENRLDVAVEVMANAPLVASSWPHTYGFKSFHHQQEDERIQKMTSSFRSKHSHAAPISPPASQLCASTPVCDKDNFDTFSSPGY